MIEFNRKNMITAINVPLKKIIWEYKLALERRGHQVDIMHLDELSFIKNEKRPSHDFDVVHIHMEQHMVLLRGLIHQLRHKLIVMRFLQIQLQ